MKLSRLKFEYNSLKRFEEILLQHNIKSDIFNSKKIKMVPLNKNENFKNNYIKKGNNIFKLYYDNIVITILKKENLYSIFEITLKFSLKKYDLIKYIDNTFKDNPEIKKTVKKIIEIENYFYNKENLFGGITHVDFNYNEFEISTISLNKVATNFSNLQDLIFFYQTEINFKTHNFISWFLEKHSLKYNIKNDFDFLESFNLSILEVIDY